MYDPTKERGKDKRTHLVNGRRIPPRFNLALPLRAPLVLQLLRVVPVDVVPGSDRDSIAGKNIVLDRTNMQTHPP